MFLVVFRNRKRAGMDAAAYSADAEAMERLAQAQPGYRHPDGESDRPPDHPNDPAHAAPLPAAAAVGSAPHSGHRPRRAPPARGVARRS